MDSLDFVHMKPDNAVVKGSTMAKDAKATVRTLAEPGKVSCSLHQRWHERAELSLDLPKGRVQSRNG